MAILEHRPGVSSISRENLLGVGISAVNLDQALERIQAWAKGGHRTYVCLAAAHSLLDCQRDAELRKVFNASGLTTPDGMPLVWLLRLRGHEHVTRVYGADLMRSTCAASVPLNLGHFFLGGGPGVAERLSRSLSSRTPGLRVCGWLSPPFRPLSPEEDRGLVEEINAAKPEILWVGLGSPKQEHWMAEHRSRIDAPVIIGVGAAFDFLSGHKPQAPRWMQRSGLEWLFRLAHEPRRLWRRYAAYPLFLLLLTLQATGLKRYRLDP
jgi:N-acetylglucosaminyldiphosphoundecaprenol N-acetyl-beta-D-mannosaminyltransferase